MPPLIGTVAGLPLFDGVEAGELARVAGLFATRNYTRGETIARRDGARTITMLLTGGAAQLVVSGGDERRVGLALLEPGAVFGCLPFTEGTVERAEALSDCSVIEIESADLERITSLHPIVAGNLVRIVGERAAAAEARLAVLAFQSVPARLATVLLDLAERFGRVTPNGVRIDLRLTHGQLAELVSTTRETVTKAAGWLTAEGLVSLGRRELWLRDVAGVESVARGERQMPGRGSLSTV